MVWVLVRGPRYTNKRQTLDQVQASIEQHVELEKLGTPTKLLGMELTWGLGYVKLTQKLAIDNLTKEFGITLTIPTKSLPLNINNYSEIKEEESNPEIQKRYQSLVGSLLYIARHTRPEISLHVNLLGRRTSHATSSNLKVALQVLRYLASSSEDGIIIKSPEQRNDQTLEKHIEIKGYADTSYGGEKAKSQSRSLVLLNGQATIWSSRRQDTTALSITEAEYIACTETAKDIRWIDQFLAELLPTKWSPPTLYVDNEAAIKLTKTQTFHRRTRHMEHRHHYIRELVDQKKVVVKGIPGKENPADPLTKLIPMTSLTKWKKEIF